MPTTLELCEKYFGTKDIYKLMNLTKDSLEKDGKLHFYIIFCMKRFMKKLGHGFQSKIAFFNEINLLTSILKNLSRLIKTNNFNIFEIKLTMKYTFSLCTNEKFIFSKFFATFCNLFCFLFYFQ